MHWQTVKESIIAPCYYRLMKILRIQQHLPFTAEGQAAAEVIYETLKSGRPCMICRFGATEVRLVEGRLNRHLPLPLKLWKALTLHHWDFPAPLRALMLGSMGFYPDSDAAFERFADLIIQDAKDIDVLASWRREEFAAAPHWRSFERIPFTDLEPYYHSPAWSRALAGKKVLVIHPFAKTIRSQYAKREKLFADPTVLPEFELMTYVPVFRMLNADDGRFPDWFAALDFMKGEIDQLDFDVALVAAGPFGFPLAAHIKRSGRQAVHMGGILQILFGISGARWDRVAECRRLYNEHWCRPSSAETPPTAKTLEGGCYW